jgi:hypothetical protein
MEEHGELSYSMAAAKRNEARKRKASKVDN